MHSMEILRNVSSALLLALFLLISAGGGGVESKNQAVSVDLIHRDSPGSPWYDPSQTPFERVMKSIARSYKRKASLTKTYLQSTSATPLSNSVVTPINPDPDSGEFLIPAQIGTPGQKVDLIADTGSDLLWTQCRPCGSCYPQNDPIFNPFTSTSYKRVPGGSQACTGNGFSNEITYCGYISGYGDGSYTFGKIANETVTLFSTAGIKREFNNTLFGCGNFNQGLFSPYSSGIMGLGGGAISFPSQSHQTNFSYCLTPYASPKPSTITFGTNPQLTGPNVMTTPLLTLDPVTYYYVYCQGASVGSQRFNTPAGGGNIILDSGTALTYLQNDLYNNVETAIKAAIHATPAKPPDGLTLCYTTTVPPPVNVTIYFTGVSLVVTKENLFLQTNSSTFCLSMVSAGTAPGSLAIFGYVNQPNNLIQYNLESRTVSFLPKNCP